MQSTVTRWIVFSWRILCTLLFKCSKCVCFMHSVRVKWTSLPLAERTTGNCFDALIPAVANGNPMNLSSREAYKQKCVRVYECKSVLTRERERRRRIKNKWKSSALSVKRKKRRKRVFSISSVKLHFLLQVCSRFHLERSARVSLQSRRGEETVKKKRKEKKGKKKVKWILVQLKVTSLHWVVSFFVLSCRVIWHDGEEAGETGYHLLVCMKNDVISMWSLIIHLSSLSVHK